MSSVGMAETSAVAGADAASLGGGYAGFWRRVAAFIIDILITFLMSMLVIAPISFALGVAAAYSPSFTQGEATAAGIGFAVDVIIQWLYFTILEASAMQATLGKRLLGMKVTDTDGRRIGFGKANGRYWSKIFSALILFIGFLMVAFTKQKQGLHDLMAGTLVLKR